MGEFSPLRAIKEYIPKVLSSVTSPEANVQRTMDLFDQYEAQQGEFAYRESTPEYRGESLIPPSLKPVLTPDMHNYIAIDLPQALESGTPVSWLTLVESFGMRAAAFESVHGQDEQSVIVNEDNATKELNLGKDSSYGSYTDAKLRMDASWTDRYQGEDWTLSGFARCEMASQQIMKQGVIETRVDVQATEDRSQHSISIIQQNLDDPDSLSYSIRGVFDREGNPVTL